MRTSEFHYRATRRRRAERRKTESAERGILRNTLDRCRRTLCRGRGDSTRDKWGVPNQDGGRVVGGVSVVRLADGPPHQNTSESSRLLPTKRAARAWDYLDVVMIPQLVP